MAIGLAAASAAVVRPAAAQTTDPLAGKDASPWPGVVVRSYGETPAMIPGFKTVLMRDVIVQPGAKTMRWLKNCPGSTGVICPTRSARF